MSESPPNHNQSDNNWEAKQTLTAFVKIVERFPPLYSSHVSEACRTRHDMENAWKQVYKAVRKELGLSCTVDELKSKWKGIRSSYARYKTKSFQNLQKGKGPPKEYYLAQVLEFLEPHVKMKWTDKSNDAAFVSYDEADDSFEGDHNNPEWLVLKPEPEDDDDDVLLSEPLAQVEPPQKKNKTEDKNIEEDNDLQFFKCMLPDIAHFTPQEKRKFKIGVLKLIDDIESERAKVSTSTSSKY